MADSLIAVASPVVLPRWEKKKGPFHHLVRLHKNCLVLLLCIGGFNDIVAPKRSRLSSCMIEAMLTLKHNDGLIDVNTININQLDDDWKKQIPKRDHI